ncbi:MAG: MFS transporter, partial [Acidimicrobiia bacterium]
MSVHTAETKAPTRPNPIRRVVNRFAPELTGAELLPLFVLFGLNLVDEFDIQATNILGPNLRDAFGLSNAGLGGIRTAAALPGLLIPFVGLIGDRYNRVRLSWVAAIVWGIFAFSTGLVPGTMIWLLVLVRMGSGTAKLVNFPVHTSLLFDYYPPSTRGRVFGIYRGADAVAALAGPAVAGLVAWLLDWRWAFFLLAIPTFALAWLAMRLAEPVRGSADDLQAALGAAQEPHVPFARAIRWLYSVPALKRIFFGAFCTGLGGIAYSVYSPVFLDDVFGVSELGRGIIVSSGAPFALLALYISGRAT